MNPDVDKLKRPVLNLIQVVIVAAAALGAGVPQIEGTSNTTDLILVLAGLAVTVVGVVVNRGNTTPISDPKTSDGRRLTP